MTTRCLSFIEFDAPQVVANHKHYASRLGYQHRTITLTGIQTQAHRLLLKYESLYHHLCELPEMASLVCFTEDCLVLNLHRVEPMMEGRQHLHMTIDGATRKEQVAVQVWRNTRDIRTFIVECIERCKISGPVHDEIELLASLDFIEPHAELAGVMATMFCNPRFNPIWTRYANLWTIVMSEDAAYGHIHPAFRNALARHVNDHQQKGVRLLDFSAQCRVPDEEFTVFNPGRSAALVTYYTPNVRDYGAIAETNFRRYCERHGYTLYVYRQTPAEVGPGISGTWLKPWFLRKHLPHHDWVMWVDADILFVDQKKPLAPLFRDRDIVAAHDIGPWVINAGVLGFRRKPAVLAFIDEIHAHVSAAPDKSSTYANGGDQTIIANLLEKRLGWKLENGFDCMSINTPWYFQQPDSLMVHYLAMWTPMRAMLMAEQERASLQIG
jgi:hypothetical protein